MVQDMLGQSTNIIAIAKATKLSRQTVYRIKDDPAATETALTLWGYDDRASSHRSREEHASPADHEIAEQVEAIDAIV
jgi:hypothetical protein